MNRPPDRDKLVMQICDQLIALDAQERPAFLSKIAAKDPSLKDEVESLLESIENSGEFMILNDSETEW